MTKEQEEKIPLTTKPKYHGRIYKIALQMIDENLYPEFVKKIVKHAWDFEGIYDFMNLWHKEIDCDERNNILIDLQRAIKDIEKFED